MDNEQWTMNNEQLTIKLAIFILSFPSHVHSLTFAVSHSINIAFSGAFLQVHITVGFIHYFSSQGGFD